MFLCLSFTGLFETLPGHVQCEMLLKATEQCFNTLEKAEMLLLLLKRFPESVVQHGVSYKNVPPVCRHLIEEEASHKRGFVFFSFQVNLGETLLEAETSENVESPVNCFRKLFGDFNIHYINLETPLAKNMCIFIHILCNFSLWCPSVGHKKCGHALTSQPDAEVHAESSWILHWLCHPWTLIWCTDTW